ncbi:hypothetical protein J4439_08290 [Candidatus Woesearchaeota archaeon]|nr:hypothetical protein [Candidatus Woesearchaeota archaeon]
MRRGFFSADALIALIVTATVALAVLLLLRATPDESGQEQLHLAAVDSGAVLEAEGSLRLLASGDASGVESYLDGLPEELCAEVALHDASGSLVQLVRRDGCADPRNTTRQVSAARRVLPAGDTSYLVVLMAWYR